MPQERSQKLKLLKLIEIFYERTDENHPLTTKQLLAALAEQGISCDRRTLAQDILLLNQSGYEILDTKIRYEKAYFIVDRAFSPPELRILIDAVRAARFITEEKSAEMIDKIAALGGNAMAERLKQSMMCNAVPKHSNNAILFIISELETAIRMRRQVSFLYFYLDENGRRVYRQNGERYFAHPMSLVYSRDNYYLLSYNTEHDRIDTYRIDRMENVTMIQDSISPRATLSDDLAEHTAQVFSMFSGEKVRITLEFTSEVIGAIYDRFGENTNIRRSAFTTYLANVDVQISPPFWGWLFQYVGKMKVIAPHNVVEEYTRLAQNANKLQEGE